MQKGFTLIELIIYVAIVGLVAGAFVSFSIAVTNSNTKTYVAQEVQANSRIALDLITQKIQAATGVNLVDSTFGSDPGVLSLSFASDDLDPTIIQLSEDDGILQVVEGVSSPVNITSDEVKVTNLQFTNLTGTSDKENIKIDLTVEYDASEDVEFKYAQTLETSATVRQ